MGGFSLMNMQNYFNLINNSTFVENINKGITQTNDYFGTKTIQGMALNTGMFIIRVINLLIILVTFSLI